MIGREPQKENDLFSLVASLIILPEKQKIKELML